MRIEDVEIDWTWASIEHIARHGVDPEEVEECIYEDAPMVFRTYRKGKLRYVIYCRCQGGKYLTVVVTPPENGFIRVITARDMTAGEKAKYRRLRR